MDERDRLIIALSALLRAERETRDAFETAIEAGVSREVLRAIVSDPVPVITQFDLEAAERVLRLAAPSVRQRAA